ncbi:MAG TPA: hypothetical protein VMD25_04060 [Acidobacteriaceae bacterium]|nr:hypothetical protein [Acidobacteriaceae bacterium]
MRFATKAALASGIAAIPFEFLSCWLGAFPLDIGLPPGAPWWRQIAATEWTLIHLPGLKLLLWLQLDRYPVWGMFTIVASGYVDTALCLFLAILFASLVRRWTASRKTSSRRSTLDDIQR